MRGHPVDKLDIDLLTLLVTEPKAGVREYSRRLGVARGTTQSRLDKLVERGVVTNFAPELDPAELGFPLNANVHLTLRQTDLNRVTARLAEIPFVIRADSVAGADDMSCSIVAKDHTHLEDICQAILAIEGVARMRTEIVLRHRIPNRTLPLLRHVRGEV